ncbi:MAG: Maf family protein [Steroidobacteraceae bacterium]
MTLPARLILASTSPYRRALLGRLGVEFSVDNPEVDERHAPGESPSDRASRLAAAKAQAVAARHRDAVVIGSDQVASAAGAILDKPGAAPAAREQLTRLSGTTALFHTACTVLRSVPAFSASHLDTTRAVFRPLSAAEIDRYIARERAFDCAGSFKSESLGASLLDRIESTDPTALIGLPLLWLCSALRALGYEVP